MLSNVEFEKLFRQFEPMIIKLVTKWSRIGVIEYDDLMQFALLELVNAAKGYDKTRGTKFSTFIYNSIEYRIRKEIYITNRKNKRYKTVSLNTTIESVEGDTTELIDLIANDINIQEEIEDKLMIQTYRSEIEKYLDEKKANIMILKYFHNMSNSYIEKVMDMSSISSTITQSRMELIRKSKLFRSEYNRIHHIDDYSNPAAAII